MITKRYVPYVPIIIKRYVPYVLSSSMFFRLSACFGRLYQIIICLKENPCYAGVKLLGSFR